MKKCQPKHDIAAGKDTIKNTTLYNVAHGDYDTMKTQGEAISPHKYNKGHKVVTLSE